jgi:hypothetical protein
MQPQIGVVYLARMAEGISPLERFADSYAKSPAGVVHDLVVIYKGYDNAADLRAAKSIFAFTPHIGIELPDTGFDIGAYLAAARRLNHEYLCFVNTFTEIAAEGWLASLYRAAVSPGVGLAGSMGSYESLYDSVALIHKVAWLCNSVRIKYDQHIAYYYGHIIDHVCKSWRARGEGEQYPWWNPPDPLIKLIYRWCRGLPARVRHGWSMRGSTLEDQFQRHWNGLLQPGQQLSEYSNFPPFPNPHIRSNGFMIDRRRLLEIGSTSINTKIDACAFESGVDSLTARLRKQGLEALVVGRNGQRYDVWDWARSRTFRLDRQENLLLTDNQSRQFDLMTAGTRATHLRITWGDYLQPAPSDYPDLGFKFAALPAAINTSLALMPDPFNSL